MEKLVSRHTKQAQYYAMVKQNVYGQAVNADNNIFSNVQKAEHSQNIYPLILSYKNTIAFNYETGFEKERVGTKHHYTINT